MLIFMITVGIMALLGPFTIVDGQQRTWMHGRKMSSIDLDPSASRTLLRPLKLPSPDTPVHTNFVVNAPAGRRVLLKCINGDTVIECTTGTLKIINGLPQATCQKDLETDDSSMTILIINFHQVSDKTICEAYVLPGRTASSPFESTLDSEGEQRNTSCPCGWRNQKRIVGGTEASINEFPLMAGLVDKGTGSRFCGGSIITNTFILTAAHCLDDTTASDVRVAVGDHDMAGRVRTGYEQSIDALRFIIHNKWNTKRVVNDIAIIQLARKINFNQNVGPVCLPSSVVDLEGQTVTAMGWGMTKTYMENDRGVLRKVDLKVEDLLPCVKAYGHMINFHKPTQICSYGRNKDTCQGDSGGPLVWLDPQTNRLTQVGLVSFGAECGSTSPGVNTDVAVFMPWINSVLKRLAPEQAVCTKI